MSCKYSGVYVLVSGLYIRVKCAQAMESSGLGFYINKSALPPSLPEQRSLN